MQTQTESYADKSYADKSYPDKKLHAPFHTQSAEWPAYAFTASTITAVLPSLGVPAEHSSPACSIVVTFAVKSPWSLPKSRVHDRRCRPVRITYASPSVSVNETVITLRPPRTFVNHVAA